MNDRTTLAVLPLITLALLAVPAAAEDAAPAATKPAPEAQAQARPADAAPPAATTAGGPKRISGMSILGNQEAPKALVIVPWKSSEIGDAAGIDALLDDSRRPVDRDVFLRELMYYEIRSQ